MLLPVRTYIKTQIKRPLEAMDLLYAGLFFALLLTLPSYFGLMYKITVSMGGWRVPLMKFSWYFTFFVTSNILWLVWSIVASLVSRVRAGARSSVYLYVFLLSNTIGAVVIGTDFINYNLFREHWSYTSVTAAFYGINGGQVPLGLGLFEVSLAVCLIASTLLLLLLLAKLVPRTKYLSRITPISLSMGIFCILFSLMGIQRAVTPTWHSLELQHGIPWITFVKRSSSYYVDDAFLSEASEIEKQKKEMLLNIEQQMNTQERDIVAENTPNILMIHVEGMRSDMLQEAFMPRVSSFATQHAEILRNHYSSSNNTGHSIFGLLTGLYGTFYQNFRESPTEVAPFWILENLGYKLMVHNSVPNDYQDIGKLFFSKFQKHDVLEGVLEDRESRLFDETARQLCSYSIADQPRFDYVFLNSTHFPYAYPESYEKFTPVMSNLSYNPDIRDDMAINRTYLKNNYLNSVNFADALLAKLLTTIVDTDYWKNTIVIIVGDHGQEFWEHNRFGHVYGLVKEQTQVISLVSFPGRLNTQYRYTSHHDIFPTIFSYMNLNVDLNHLMSGKNLYQFDSEKDYSLISMSVLSGQKRYEEAIVSKDLKVRYHLKDKLTIEAVTDEDDVIIDDFEKVKPKVYSLIKKAYLDKRAGTGKPYSAADHRNI